MFIEDYKTLGIPSNASGAEIKAAYRRLVKVYHPDVSKNLQDHQRFLQIQRAYERLTHPTSPLETSIPTPPPSPKSEEAQHAHEDIKSKARENVKKQRERKKKEQESLDEYMTEMGYKDLLSAAILLGKTLIVASIISFPAIAYVLFNPFSVILVIVFLLLSSAVYHHRKDFFKTEPFPYLKNKLHQLRYRQNDLLASCSFAPGELAEEQLEQKLYFMKITDVTMRSKGMHDQHLSFDRVHEMVVLPRSRRALYAHTAYACINLATILLSLAFLDISSFLWRIILGLFIGLFLSHSMLALLKIAASSAFLITRVFLLKSFLYLSIITAFTSFSFGNIDTNPFIRVTLVLIVFIDPLIESLLKKPAPDLLTRPLLKTAPEIKTLIRNNYQYNLDIPGWNLLYPIVKIVVG